MLHCLLSTILFAGLGFNFKLAILNLWTDTYKYFLKNFYFLYRLAKGFAIGSMAINLQEKWASPPSLKNIEFGWSLLNVTIAMGLFF
jgi:hypothetical protein